MTYHSTLPEKPILHPKIHSIETTCCSCTPTILCLTKVDFDHRSETDNGIMMSVMALSDISQPYHKCWPYRGVKQLQLFLPLHTSFCPRFSDPKPIQHSYLIMANEILFLASASPGRRIARSHPHGLQRRRTTERRQALLRMMPSHFALGRPDTWLSSWRNRIFILGFDLLGYQDG